MLCCVLLLAWGPPSGLFRYTASRPCYYRPIPHTFCLPRANTLAPNSMGFKQIKRPVAHALLLHN